MNREEILQKSREEQKSAYLDERERGLRLREDAAAYGFGLALALVLLVIKICRGQPAADILTMITSMSAAGFAYVAVKNRKRSDAVFAVLCSALAVFYFVRFLLGGT